LKSCDSYTLRPLEIKSFQYLVRTGVLPLL
jgi:hypothetical protein